MNVDMRTRHVNIMGISYKGNVSKTVSGLTCQRWSSQYPHRHSLGTTEPSNYCRNVPEFERGPWCYTSSSSKRWDLCDVPLCSKSHLSPAYIYTTTSSKRWDLCDVPLCSKSHLSLAYIYTTTSSKRWDLCEVPMCSKSHLSLAYIYTTTRIKWLDLFDLPSVMRQNLV